MQVIDFIFVLAAFLFSVVLHEISHGFVAEALGDKTARHAGRLTLNPIPHLDPVGSIMLPFLLLVTALVSGTQPHLFGWAKPVPFNPHNLQAGRYGPALVAFAGVATNFVIAIFFSIILYFVSSSLTESVIGFIHTIIFINILLGVFNLIPIPPLDGSRVLAAFLPLDISIKYEGLERYGLMLVIAFVFFGWPIVSPIVNLIFSWLV